MHSSFKTYILWKCKSDQQPYTLLIWIYMKRRSPGNGLKDHPLGCPSIVDSARGRKQSAAPRPPMKVALIKNTWQKKTSPNIREFVQIYTIKRGLTEKGSANPLFTGLMPFWFKTTQLVEGHLRVQLLICDGIYCELHNNMRVCMRVQTLIRMDLMSVFGPF